tara:strand:- start:4363 stop:4515 length:153 start_codon:yes stop_codon:yes gene_type:complete
MNNYDDLEKRIEILEKDFNCNNLEKKIETLENEVRHIKAVLQYQSKKKSK